MSYRIDVIDVALSGLGFYTGFSLTGIKSSRVRLLPVIGHFPVA